MTREEKIEILEKEKAYMLVHGGDRQAEALTSAVIALEQEPCEDCISRKEVLDYLNKMPSELTSDGRRMVRRRTLEEYISDTLPPVNPQKSGHWKFVQRGKFIDICCPKCGYVRVKEYAYNYTIDQITKQDRKEFFSNSNMNFCENCGTKMAESEDQTDGNSNSS